MYLVVDDVVCCDGLYCVVGVFRVIVSANPLTLLVADQLDIRKKTH